MDKQFHLIIGLLVLDGLILDEIWSYKSPFCVTTDMFQRFAGLIIYVSRIFNNIMLL